MRERLEALLAANPERADLALALAQLCLRDKDAEAALQFAQQAVDAKPGYSAALLAAGQAAKAMGDLLASKEWFLRAETAAQEHGDKQIERQVAVFLKRMES